MHAALLLMTTGFCVAEPGREAAIALAAHQRRHRETVQPLLARYCTDCHGADQAKGKLRLDNLPHDFLDDSARTYWLAAQQRLRAGEMPPKGRPQPTPAERREIDNWIQEGAAAAATTRRREQGRVPLRRLNRVEYENTLRDLLGIEVELQDLLPLDTAAQGFDNVSVGQHTSSFLMERYLEAADRALSLAIANEPQPPRVRKRYHCTTERQFLSTTERVFRMRGDTLELFTSSPWQALTLRQSYPPHRGKYRYRLNVEAVQSGGKPVTFRVLIGPMLMASKNRLVGYFDAPAGQSTDIEIEATHEARCHINLLPYGLASAQAVHKEGADRWQGPGLAIHGIEVDGPIHEQWPPASHRRLFGNLPQVPAPTRASHQRVEVASKEPENDLRRVLGTFTRRAFRRAVTAAEVEPFLKLAHAQLQQGRTFEQAARVGLLAILMSPDFLFLREAPGKLDDFALASRLSYFLWSTMPDDELFTLAERGQLQQPAVLRQQVERLLNDSRAANFHRHFVGQWLGLRDIDFTEPSHILYPEYDELLKVSMVGEAEAFFAELLRQDLSVSHLIQSDFSMLNGRLARHYGIPGVEGYAFRRVQLPPGSHRGGVLTMAGVLKVTANGTTTSPVTRGVWVLDRILGTPPSPPPADVPAVEPDIRGATTIREQLAKHRQQAVCASCHVRIDPPGFALESFDVIGGWREHYRTTGRGKPVMLEGRRMHYLQGPPIDPADCLPDGRRFANIDQLKELLVQDIDRIAAALTSRLLTYATGAAPEPADRAEVEAIVARTRAAKLGLRSLVQEIVRSQLFQTK